LTEVSINIQCDYFPQQKLLENIMNKIETKIYISCTTIGLTLALLVDILLSTPLVEKELSVGAIAMYANIKWYVPTMIFLSFSMLIPFYNKSIFRDLERDTLVLVIALLFGSFLAVTLGEISWMIHHSWWAVGFVASIVFISGLYIGTVLGKFVSYGIHYLIFKIRRKPIIHA
jgi:hypothetical protein